MMHRRRFLTLAGSAGASLIAGCAPPAAGRWNHSEIDRLDTAARAHGGSGWAALHHGRQIAAWRPEQRGPSLSITKSIAALAAAAAIRRGWLDPAENASDTFHEWRADPRRSRITVSMLLQQTSGLDAGVAALYRSHPADKGKAAVAIPAVDAPGTVFRYGPSHWEALAELLRRKLPARESSFPSFLNRSVLAPIGIGSPRWRTDKRDMPYLSTGAEFSVRDLARLGAVLARLLRGENASGFHADDFAAVTRPSHANPIFGGGLWRNTNSAAGTPIEIENSIDHPLPRSFWARACLSPRQPAGFTSLIGSGGRRVYLWPEEDKVIARLGDSNHWSDLRFLSNV